MKPLHMTTERVNHQPTERVNHQHIEKSVHRENGSLDVVSIFATIQGEGPFAGFPAVFIRLAGCDLDCPSCDTDYTSGRHLLSVEEIIDKVEELAHRDTRRGPPARPGTNLIVLTGGEPLRQNVCHLISGLLRDSWKVQIETNGTLYVEGLSLLHGGSNLTIVCSPKTTRINQDVARIVDAYKYILSADKIDPVDGLPTDSLNNGCFPARPTGLEICHPVPIFVQPCDEGDDERNRKNIEAAIHSCQRYGYILCLQLHKIIGLP